MKAKTIITVILVMIIPFLLILLNFSIILFDDGLYNAEFRKHEVYNSIPEASQINSKVLDYFKNDDILINSDFFNQQEKRHLYDVKVLINKVLAAFYLLTAFSLVLFVTLAIVIKDVAKMLKNVSLIAIFGSGLSFIIGFIGWLVARLDFSGFFTGFHHILFPRGNWMFDSQVDKIVVLYPQGFFYDIFRNIMLDSLIAAFILGLVGFLFLYALNKKVFKQEE